MVLVLVLGVGHGCGVSLNESQLEFEIRNLCQAEMQKHATMGASGLFDGGRLISQPLFLGPTVAVPTVKNQRAPLHQANMQSAYACGR